MNGQINLTTLSHLSTKDLLALYNKHADEPIERFSDAQTAFRRTKALLDSKGVLVAKSKSVASSKDSGLNKIAAEMGLVAAKKPSPSNIKQARCKVLVAPLSKPDATKEYHSVLAAFIALGLPVEKHQRFRRQLKLNGKASIAQFVFTATY